MMDLVRILTGLLILALVIAIGLMMPFWFWVGLALAALAPLCAFLGWSIGAVVITICRGEVP